VACTACKGCESPFKGTRASTSHLSQSLRYCQQAGGDLNGVKLTLYAYYLRVFAWPIARIGVESDS